MEHDSMQCVNCGNEISVGVKFCPGCGSAVEIQNASPIEVAPAKGKSLTRRAAVFVFPIVLIAGILTYVRYLSPSVNEVIKDQPVVVSPFEYDSTFVESSDIAFREEGTDLVFPLDQLKQLKLVRFEYRGGKTPRHVLAYLAPTGQLVTAISVSEHCGSTEFKIKDDKIYCAHCPSYWDMMTMEAYACCSKYFPDPIPSRVVGSDVHIPKILVEKWAGRM
jgi:hypothetical protein